MNKSSESYKVYLDKTEAAKSGVTSQKEVGGQSYPGRALPPAHTVEHAKEVEGASRTARLKQLGENRKEINKHVEKNDGQ